MARLKWSYKKFVEFLKDYKFNHGHTKGSHFYYNGKIYGEDRVV
jgi:predicted RNA binding protein YcfA (HicA-like mRNA interferase family)